MILRIHLPLLCLLFSFYAFQNVSGEFRIEYAEADSVVCFGEASGKIRIEISGGTAPYFFSYTGPNGTGVIFTSSTFHEFTGVRAGLYSISVFDIEDNLATSFLQVLQPAQLVTLVSPNPADICRNSDRQLNGNPSGGNGSYIHQWTGRV
jgi:large repetitive protein